MGGQRGGGAHGNNGCDSCCLLLVCDDHVHLQPVNLFNGLHYLRHHSQLYILEEELVRVR